MLARIQSLILERDIEMLADPSYIPDTSNTVYIIFMIIGIIGYFTIPTVTGWIIQAGGAGNFTRNVNQTAMKTGNVASAGAGSAAGNIGGQVVGETAKSLSERFGKVLQKRQSISINRNDTSTSISTQLDSLIPASKISTLTQGMFVGAVSDNFEERIDQKIFHAEIVVDNDKVAAETKAYQKIPEILFFVDENGTDNMKQEIENNYKQIKQDIVQIVEKELERIKNDPDLQHLVQK